MNFEEKTIASQLVFKGRIIEVRVDRVSLPNGQESTREIVMHGGAVAVVPLDEQGNIWMVRQYRKPIEKVMLEIPAGTLERGEDPLVCARRELQEETGMTAKQWEKVTSYYSAPGFCNEILHIFLATGLEHGVSHPDDDEFVETVRVPLGSAYEMIFCGDIADGKSIIGIQYAYHKMREKA